MWIWILAAWTFIPGVCWIFACSIVQHRQRKALRRGTLTIRHKIHFEQMPSDDGRFVFLAKSRYN